MHFIAIQSQAGYPIINEPTLSAPILDRLVHSNNNQDEENLSNQPRQGKFDKLGAKPVPSVSSR